MWGGINSHVPWARLFRGVRRILRHRKLADIGKQVQNPVQIAQVRLDQILDDESPRSDSWSASCRFRKYRDAAEARLRLSILLNRLRLHGPK